MLYLQLSNSQAQSFLAFAVENLSIILSKSWLDLNVSHILA